MHLVRDTVVQQDLYFNAGNNISVEVLTTISHYKAVSPPPPTAQPAPSSGRPSDEVEEGSWVAKAESGSMSHKQGTERGQRAAGKNRLQDRDELAVTASGRMGRHKDKEKAVGREVAAWRWMKPQKTERDVCEEWRWPRYCCRSDAPGGVRDGERRRRQCEMDTWLPFLVPKFPNAGAVSYPFLCTRQAP